MSIFNANASNETKKEKIRKKKCDASFSSSFV